MGIIKQAIRRWLGIKEAQEVSFFIQEQSTYRTNVFKNRILYRGDPSELDQFFKSTATDKVTQARFWASSPSKGNNIRKMHSGLPGMIVNVLSDIVVTDMAGVEFETELSKDMIDAWEKIEEENDFKGLITESVEEVLVVGDGAYKISIDTTLSEYPILEFFGGEGVEYKLNRGRVEEIHFFTLYEQENQKYTLKEIYGKGFVNYELYNDKDKLVDLSAVNELADLVPVTFAGDYIMAIPFKIYPSPKWKDKGRGRSIFDLKTDEFDALDETISQWQDAIRLGRIKRYIPESLIPKNPKTGELLPINPLDNQFTALADSMREDGESKIVTDQPAIQYEGYLATYISNLDRCLQGLVSPSTLGIDTKKLDNAEAQREKEKTTLYTRQKIIDVLYKVLPELVNIALKANATLNDQAPQDVQCKIDFGEYANPSFEAQVETIGKAASSLIMSTEAQVQALWGDTKDEKWKKEEVQRILAEKGISEMAEPMMAPHGYQEESMIDDMDRLGNRAPNRDGDPNVQVDGQEPQEAPNGRDEGGTQVDPVAGVTVEEPPRPKKEIN